MKNAPHWILAILFLSHANAQDFLTTTPIKVAGGSGNHHPQVELIEAGRVGVTWTSNGSKNVYFAKHNGLDGFDSPVQLNPDGMDVQSYDWSGPDFAVEGDNVYVVFRSYGYETGHIYIVKSTDKGETFGDTVRVDYLDAGFGQYPDLAVFNDTVYVTFMNHDDGGANPSYDVVRSVDGGLTFEEEVTAASIIEGESCDCCQPEIIVNEEKLVLFFRNNDENIRDIKGVISTDRGASFTDWISVDDHNWYIEACPSTGPDAHFISDSKVVASYKSEVAGEGKVFLNVYDLEADVSTDLVEIYGTSGTAGSLNYPQVCYDDEVIGVVWEDGATGSSIDVFFNQSSATSIDFNPDNAINLTALAAVQSKPDITLENGVYHVVYADATDFSVYYIQIAQANSIQESALEFEVSQTTDQITVKYDGLESVQITITDLHGRIITETRMNSQTLNFETNSWDSGVYFITLISGESRSVKKIVK
jgi:hypothetical protein